jgi:hypothetical protein
MIKKEEKETLNGLFVFFNSCWVRVSIITKIGGKIKSWSSGPPYFLGIGWRISTYLKLQQNHLILQILKIRNLLYPKGFCCDCSSYFRMQNNLVDSKVYFNIKFELLLLIKKNTFFSTLSKTTGALFNYLSHKNKTKTKNPKNSFFQFIGFPSSNKKFRNMCIWRERKCFRLNLV